MTRGPNPTAVAPNAKALATSEPLRTPESKSTGMPSAALTTPGKLQVKAGHRWPGGAMVRAIDAVDAVIARFAHIVGVLNALEQHR